MAGLSFDAAALTIARRAFARQMLALAGVEDAPLLEDALASVERERFLPDPPWQVAVFGGGYRSLPNTDPVVLYQDVNPALDPARGVNNGSPSLHAKWLSRARIGRGDRVAHIGAGTGYYSAVIAHMVGATGHVLAVECDPALAARAQSLLAPLGNASIVQDDGAEWPADPVDLVYVSFLVRRPADSWIERLRPGGRLVFPLGVPLPRRATSGGVHTQYGAGLLIERTETGFSAAWLGAAFFVHAEGRLADSADTEALRASFERGGVEFIRSLHWKRAVPAERCWFVGTDWSLGYDPPP